MLLENERGLQVGDVLVKVPVRLGNALSIQPECARRWIREIGKRGIEIPGETGRSRLQEILDV